MKKTIATFATMLRASSLCDDLMTECNILAWWSSPKWTNKKLPPPNVQVSVNELNAERAAAFYAEWRKR